MTKEEIEAIATRYLKDPLGPPILYAQIRHLDIHLNRFPERTLTILHYDGNYLVTITSGTTQCYAVGKAPHLPNAIEQVVEQLERDERNRS